MTADFGSAHKQTTAFLEDSKCHRKPWWASSALANRGMKGDVALWFKAGETNLTENGNWKKNENMINSPSGFLHSHDILKEESGIKSQPATSVAPVRSPLLLTVL